MEMKTTAITMIGATVLGAALLGTTGTATAGTTTAVAAPNCGSWPGNGLADHDVKTLTATVSGRTVKVALVNQRLSDHSFSAVRSGYRSGDQTWVDRSYDGGSTWAQCGPFNSQFSNDLSNLGNWMRACVRFNGASFCTGWYLDND
jgi:hypothetical protein